MNGVMQASGLIRTPPPQPRRGPNVPDQWPVAGEDDLLLM